MGDLVFPQICLDLGAGDMQQRPQELSPALGDAAQPRRAAAADEIEKQRLGVVVQVVGGKDAVGAVSLRRFVQEVIAQLTRRLLEAQAVLLSVPGRVAVPEDEGDAVLQTPGLHEARVPQGFLAAYAVLEVGTRHVIPLRPDKVQQAHGVGPAGHRAHDALSPGRQGISHPHADAPGRRRRYTRPAS